ncbi:hydroxymethylbilane synthase [Amycolatopsis nigrescens]|uniref:hydroxymethylbilane synthase n=1 Tax=Amycolatopsis nigrescens TaxID=381445 RepID=UPI00035DC200|nr:hydroxymethylbilane synthase [Amycolatopsis nigrescens]
MDSTIRIGARASALALAQANLVADELRKTGQRVEIVEVAKPGALPDALLNKQVDVIVRSYKGLPIAAVPGIVLAAVPTRADPRDALVARDGLTLGELPPGATVGTGSARRIAQLRALGLGLELVPVRGDIQTRAGKVAAGELDAVVLARAGLARMDSLDLITETLDPIQLLPAPAQGALAVQCRVDDVDVEHLLRSTVDDESTRVAVTAERAMLAALEADRGAPVGALAEVVEDLDADGAVLERISLRGAAAAGFDIETADMLRASAIAEKHEAEKLGRELAAELLDLGAGALSGPGRTQH